VDLLLLDLDHETENLADLIAELRRLRPDLRTVAYTGDEGFDAAALPKGLDGVLHKPFDVATLGSVLEVAAMPGTSP